MISVAEKFWCSWHMRQSLQPIWPRAEPSGVPLLTWDVVLVDGRRVLPCRCAASTVVPYRMKTTSKELTVREITELRLLKRLNIILVAL